jgi:hypothetical protein
MASPVPSFPPITRATLRAQLQNRLNNAQFWGTAELNTYLQEALTTWQAFARYWRNADTFNTKAGTFFYDLSALTPDLSYNTTDAELLSTIEYHLLEPQSGIPTAPAWAGTAMFPQQAYTDALEKRRNRFLLETASVVQHYTANNVVPGSSRVNLGSGLIDVRRAAWQGSSATGFVTTTGNAVTWYGVGAPFNTDGTWNGLQIVINAVGYTILAVQSNSTLLLTTSAGTQAAPVTYAVAGPYQILWRDDEFAANAFDPGWVNNPATPAPLAYSVVVTQPYTLQLLPPPGDAGSLDLLVIAQGVPLNPSVGVVLGIPDNYAWVVKWGALADLLSQDGPGRDLPRAKYCEARYREGVQLCRNMPTVINGSINGVSAEFDSVFNFDAYQSEWNNTVGPPTILGLASQNMLATGCVPDGSYGIGLDVVQNCPLIQNDATPVTLTADLADLIVDEAQHLALFKEGGAEFSASVSLHQNFVQQAALYRARSLAQAQYWPAMSELNQVDISQVMVSL